MSDSQLFPIVLMEDNRKALLESLITNQGLFNGSHETYWPFKTEDAPGNVGGLTSSSANFLVNHSAFRSTLSHPQICKLPDSSPTYP